MAGWLKAKLFGRQLSHGSENEDPQSFEEAFQQPQLQQAEQEFQQLQLNTDDPFNVPPPVQQLQATNVAPPMQQLQTSNVASGYGGPSPGASEMKAAYEVSKQLVRERLERENPEDVAILDSVKDTDIICVRGTFDHIHLVLQAIGIPFAHVDPSALLRMELSPESTIYVNCPSSFPREAALKLAKFVEEGGQLITTDWALKHVLEAAFPGTVKVAGSTGDEVVAVEIVDKEDEVLKGFIDQEKDAAPVWWLENCSYPIKVIDKKKVKVLVRSDELKRRYGHDPVIISFQWGKGIVYHMISHFYLQRSEIRTKKQGMSSTAYAAAQGASKATMDLFDELQTNSPGMNYGMVQSAATSSEVVSRMVINQKRRFTPSASSAKKKS